jgi:hypothetical protein
MRSRQRGWLGLVVMLVALVIVALLAKEALKQYGLLPGKPTVEKAATPGERARAAGAVGIDAVDLDSAPQAPGGALERARGLEDTLQRQADERAKQMDGVK